MGLLATLKSRFFPPESCGVARTGDVAAIAECVARTTVVAIGADLGVSVPCDSDENAVIVAVEAATKKKSFDCDIHKYQIDGDTFIPLFTDVSAAELFCGAYYSLLGHIHVFRLFEVPGAYPRHWIADQDLLVVNPQSNNEAEIDRSKSSAIRARLPKTDTFNDALFVSLALPTAGISRTIDHGPGCGVRLTTGIDGMVEAEEGDTVVYPLSPQSEVESSDAVYLGFHCLQDGQRPVCCSGAAQMSEYRKRPCGGLRFTGTTGTSWRLR